MLLWFWMAAAEAAPPALTVDLSALPSGGIDLPFVAVADGAFTLDFGSAPVRHVLLGAARCGTQRGKSAVWDFVLRADAPSACDEIFHDGAAALTVVDDRGVQVVLNVHVSEAPAQKAVWCRPGDTVVDPAYSTACSANPGSDAFVRLDVEIAGSGSPKQIRATGDDLSAWTVEDLRWKGADGRWQPVKGAFTLVGGRLLAVDAYAGLALHAAQTAGGLDVRSVKPGFERSWKVQVWNEADFQAPKPPVAPPTPPTSAWCDSVNADYGKGKFADDTRAALQGDVVYLLCLDLSREPVQTAVFYSQFDSSGKGLRQRQPTSLPYLLPNRSVHVVVRPPERRHVVLDVDGTPGVKAPLVEAGDGVEVASIIAAVDRATAAAAAPAGASGDATYEYVIAPRAADHFTLVAKVQGVGENKKLEDLYAYEHEFLVTREYVAALRTGIARVSSPRESTYALADLPNAQGKVIDEVRGPGEVVEPELVVGLTTYFERRRALPNQEKGLPGLRPTLGLYVGLGLISAADSKITFLPSVYLGPDIEISRGFSLSFCTVARRAETLLAEYKPGSVLTGNASTYKGTTIVPATAIVLNVTPAYFRQIPGLGLGNVGRTE